MLPIQVLVMVILSNPALNDPAIGAQPFASLTDSIPTNWSPLPEGGLYLRGNAGFVTTENSKGSTGQDDVKFDEGFLLSLAIGKRLTSGVSPLNFDLDLEGIWTQQDASNSGALQAVRDVTVAAIMANGTVDYQLIERLSVYAGGGIGGAWVDIGQDKDNLGDFDEEDGPFLAWQLRTGLLWWVTPRLAATAGYRFLNIDDVEMDDDAGNSSFNVETVQHSLEVGLRFGV